MDATVVAAFIGVAGAVLVAVVSSVTTQRTIRQSLADGRLSARAALDTGHEERVWDKKAALYVELLLDEARRRADRANQRRDYQAAKYGERPRGSLILYDEQAWSSFGARVRAFGSDLVVLEFNMAMEASRAVHDRDAEWLALGTQGPAAEAERSGKAVIDAMARADDADESLARQIRADLQAPLSASAVLIQSRRVPGR
jgi:hypothetical protein